MQGWVPSHSTLMLVNVHAAYVNVRLTLSFFARLGLALAPSLPAGAAFAFFLAGLPPSSVKADTGRGLLFFVGCSDFCSTRYLGLACPWLL